MISSNACIPVYLMATRCFGRLVGTAKVGNEIIRSQTTGERPGITQSVIHKMLSRFQSPKEMPTARAAWTNSLRG